MNQSVSATCNWYSSAPVTVFHVNTGRGKRTVVGGGGQYTACLHDGIGRAGYEWEFHWIEFAIHNSTIGFYIKANRAITAASINSNSVSAARAADIVDTRT